MKVYTVEQCGYEEHSIIAFYTNKEGAIAHLHCIYERLKKVLKHKYDITPIGFRTDSILELNFNEKKLRIETHFYSYYVTSYDEGKIYEDLYDDYI